MSLTLLVKTSRFLCFRNINKLICKNVLIYLKKNSQMKKIILVIFLICLNFIVFYWLTENIGINITFEEISTSLFTSIVVIPIGCLIPAFFLYTFKLYFQKIYVSFQKVHQFFYLNTALVFYLAMLLVALLTYLKSQ